MLWIGLYPDELGQIIERIGEFVLGITRAQIGAADGTLDGMVIWGDVAYTRDMFFSPQYWRRYFKADCQGDCGRMSCARIAGHLSWLWKRQEDIRGFR